MTNDLDLISRLQAHLAIFEHDEIYAKEGKALERLLREAAERLVELEQENNEYRFNDLYCPACGSCGVLECCPTPKCLHLETNQKQFNVMEKEWSAALDRADTAEKERDQCARGCAEWNDKFELWRGLESDRADKAEAIIKVLREQLLQSQQRDPGYIFLDRKD